MFAIAQTVISALTGCARVRKQFASVRRVWKLLGSDPARSAAVRLENLRTVKQRVVALENLLGSEPTRLRTVRHRVGALENGQAASRRATELYRRAMHACARKLVGTQQFAGSRSSSRRRVDAAVTALMMASLDQHPARRISIASVVFIVWNSKQRMDSAHLNGLEKNASHPLAPARRLQVSWYISSTTLTTITAVARATRPAAL